MNTGVPLRVREKDQPVFNSQKQLICTTDLTMRDFTQANTQEKRMVNRGVCAPKFTFFLNNILHQAKRRAGGKRVHFPKHEGHAIQTMENLKPHTRATIVKFNLPEASMHGEKFSGSKSRNNPHMDKREVSYGVNNDMTEGNRIMQFFIQITQLHFLPNSHGPHHAQKNN